MYGSSFYLKTKAIIVRLDTSLDSAWLMDALIDALMAAATGLTLDWGLCGLHVGVLMTFALEWIWTGKTGCCSLIGVDTEAEVLLEVETNTGLGPWKPATTRYRN